ncbi:MAG: leucine-rich repeat domain-containing protein [Bacteroidales bacterium]|nr:leucine-rich repeat domain-containing protein [Bacteroidales bacterium]
MKKLILLLTLIVSVIGLNAQTIGSYTVVTHTGYELQYTVTKLSPAECSVKCVNLTSENAIDLIAIPETMEIQGTVFTVTSVPAQGFAYCYSTRKFELPSTLTHIGDQAFYYCNLATEIAIPENVVSIGHKAFYGCAITEAVIPSGVTKLNNSVFELCKELTHVEIPNTVTSIGMMTFKTCTGLTEIDLPESLNTISDYAFSECSNLALVRCFATVPPTGNKIFYRTPEDMIIRVPAESLEAYRSTEPWSKYDIRKIGAESIEEETASFGIYPNPVSDRLFIETEMNVEEVVVYDVYGRHQVTETPSHQGNMTVDVKNLSNGIYFVRVKTENGEMVKRFVKK